MASRFTQSRVILMYELQLENDWIAVLCLLVSLSGKEVTYVCVCSFVHSMSSKFKKAAAARAACPSSPLSWRRPRRTEDGATISR